MIGSHSFPPPGQREQLTEGERRQLRDAMIFEAHVREGREVFISRDRKAFIGKNEAHRRQLEALYRTRILTPVEFCAEVRSLPARGSTAH